MGARHKIIMILGIIQNFTDMVENIATEPDEFIIANKLQEATAAAFKVWGFSVKKSDLNKMNEYFNEFQKKNLGTGEVDWAEYTSLLIGLLSDILSYIKDKTRRQILIDLQDCLGLVFDLVEGTDDVRVPEKEVEFFTNIQKDF